MAHQLSVVEEGEAAKGALQPVDKPDGAEGRVGRRRQAGGTAEIRSGGLRLTGAAAVEQARFRARGVDTGREGAPEDDAFRGAVAGAGGAVRRDAPVHRQASHRHGLRSTVPITPSRLCMLYGGLFRGVKRSPPAPIESFSSLASSLGS